jgi:hypothetical protein
MSDGGKGSNPRPFSVPKKVHDDNYDTTFGKRPLLRGFCPTCDKKLSWCECKKVEDESKTT